MGFSEDLIKAFDELGITNYVIFGTTPDGEGFALADGNQAAITETVVGGTLAVPEVKAVMCNAVWELYTDCGDEIEGEGGDG